MIGLSCLLICIINVLLLILMMYSIYCVVCIAIETENYIQGCLYKLQTVLIKVKIQFSIFIILPCTIVNVVIIII